MRFYYRKIIALIAHSAQCSVLSARATVYFKLQTAEHGTRISVSGCETVVLSGRKMLPYGFHSMTNENEEIVLDVNRLQTLE